MTTNFDEFDNFEEFENFLNKSADQEMETESFAGQEHEDNFTDEERKKIEENSKKHKSELKKFMDTGGGKGEGGEGKPGEESTFGDGQARRGIIIVTGDDLSSGDLAELTKMLGSEDAAQELKKQIEAAIANKKESVKPTEEELKKLEDTFELIKDVLTRINKSTAKDLVTHLEMTVMDYYSPVINSDRTSLNIFDTIREIFNFKYQITSLADMMESFSENHQEELKELMDGEILSFEKLAILKIAKKFTEAAWEFLCAQKDKNLTQLQKSHVPNISLMFLKIQNELGRNS
jgi:hypothetical protein